MDGNGFSIKKRETGKNYLQWLTRRIGPVVDSYPTWHPLTDGVDVIESVKALSKSKVAEISAVKLDYPLYAVDASPILVECHWKFKLESDLTIPSKVAVALMLKQALYDWERSEYVRGWENVSYCMLSSPHGQLSSLFINWETGLKMRKVWQAVCAAGVFNSICLGE